jgi:hypothetical protein
MRRLPLLGAIAIVLAATPVVGATTGRPSLRLLDRDPLTIAGRGFDAEELVRVRLAVEGQIRSRRARTSAVGTFRVRFTVSVGRCDFFSLQAFGSAGNRARLFPAALQPDCSSDD